MPSPIERSSSATEAVVFDLDGVIVDTEQVWDQVREQLAGDWGGTYSPEAQEAMMGMSSTEWSRYMHDELGLRQSPEEINAEVVRRMLERYRDDLPLLPGAVDAVRRLHGAGLLVAVASSSNVPLIEAVLKGAGLTELFSASVSSEEVARGKPAPDVYLEAARRLGADADPVRRGRGLGERDQICSRGGHARARAARTATTRRPLRCSSSPLTSSARSTNWT